MEVHGGAPFQPEEKPVVFSFTGFIVPKSWDDGTSAIKAAEEKLAACKSPIQEKHSNTPKFIQAFCQGLLSIRR